MSAQKLLEFGPLEVELPAGVGVRLSERSCFVAWSSSDLLTVSVGRYSISVTERGMILFRTN